MMMMMMIYLLFWNNHDIDGVTVKVEKNNFINIFIYPPQTENKPKQTQNLIFNYNCWADWLGRQFFVAPSILTCFQQNHHSTIDP